MSVLEKTEEELRAKRVCKDKTKWACIQRQIYTTELLPGWQCMRLMLV